MKRRKRKKRNKKKVRGCPEGGVRARFICSPGLNSLLRRRRVTSKLKLGQRGGDAGQEGKRERGRKRCATKTPRRISYRTCCGGVLVQFIPTSLL
jgi:hypothetical protein